MTDYLALIRGCVKSGESVQSPDAEGDNTHNTLLTQLKTTKTPPATSPETLEEFRDFLDAVRAGDLAEQVVGVNGEDWIARTFVLAMEANFSTATATQRREWVDALRRLQAWHADYCNTVKSEGEKNAV